MELLKEVLLIEANGLRVDAFIVENLPKKFIYARAKKLIPLDEYSDRMVPAWTIDATGKKTPTGEMMDVFLPGIFLDGAGSGGFIFQAVSDDSVQRLKEIDKYIEETIKDPVLRGKREPYAQQPGDKGSTPKSYHTIKRVKLPDSASPPAVPTAEQVRPLPALKVKTPEQIAAMKARLEKARATRAAKAVLAAKALEEAKQII